MEQTVWLLVRPLILLNVYAKYIYVLSPEILTGDHIK